MSLPMACSMAGHLEGLIFSPEKILGHIHLPSASPNSRSRAGAALQRSCSFSAPLRMSSRSSNSHGRNSRASWCGVSMQQMPAQISPDLIIGVSATSVLNSAKNFGSMSFALPAAGACAAAHNRQVKMRQFL